MAGRHGVQGGERSAHSKAVRGQRRQRASRRDAAQPWALWLLVRGLLALIVLGAVGWSTVLYRRGQGGIWPLVAIVAGGLSLLMIALDVLARRRQRARWRRDQVRAAAAARLAEAARTARPLPVAAADLAESAPAGPGGSAPDAPPQPRRRSHRR